MTQLTKHSLRSVATLWTISAVFLAIAIGDPNADRHRNDSRNTMTAALSASSSHPLLGDETRAFDRLVERTLVGMPDRFALDLLEWLGRERPELARVWATRHRDSGHFGMRQCARRLLA